MVTILHLTDPHGRLSHLQRAIERAPGHSLIAVSGDLRDWNGPATVAQLEETLAELRKLAAQAAAKGACVGVVSGNHDDWCGSSFPEAYWLDVQEESLHGDFTNTILKLDGEEVILTCMPWRDFGVSEWPAWLDKGNPVERARCKRDQAAGKDLGNASEGETMAGCEADSMGLAAPQSAIPDRCLGLFGREQYPAGVDRQISADRSFVRARA